MACNEKNPLQRDGSSQSQRFLNALDPANAPIDELGMEEWLTFAATYAKDINYFFQPFFTPLERKLIVTSKKKRYVSFQTYKISAVYFDIVSPPPECC